MKGIVNVAGTPYAINVVQTVIHEPVRLECWPDPDRRTRIVFIARGIDRAALDRAVGALAMTGCIGTAIRFDAAAYARFREAADYVARDFPAADMLASAGTKRT